MCVDPKEGEKGADRILFRPVLYLVLDTSSATLKLTFLAEFLHVCFRTMAEKYRLIIPTTVKTCEMVEQSRKE